MSDTPDLVVQAQQGNLAAFQKLVETHQRFVFVVAFRLLANEEDARDVVQETFVRVWKHLHAFQSQKSFTTWLYKIITNLCYDTLRNAYNRRTYNSLANEDLKPLLKTTVALEEHVCNTELAEKICELANGLTSRQHMVFVLRDLQDLDMQEIAEILNISISAVKSNLYYARVNIRKKMKKMGYIS